MKNEYLKYVESFKRQGMEPMTFEHWVKACETDKNLPKVDGFND